MEEEEKNEPQNENNEPKNESKSETPTTSSLIRGETTTAWLSKDCLTVIFGQLGPIDKWRCSMVCARWRRIVLLCWNGAQKQSLLSWLKKELNDFYLPYNRLSFYDRTYPRTPSEESHLYMTWPKLPLHINCYVSAVDSVFVRDRLRELFGNDRLDWSYDNDYGKAFNVSVTWEQQQVQSRVKIFQREHDELHRMSKPDTCASVDCHLIFCVGLDLLAEKILQDYFHELKGQLKHRTIYQKDFSKTENILLSGKSALIRSFGGLSVNQIYHLIRGDIPESFPSVEEFESSLPRSLILQSKENFGKLLEGSDNGSYGLVPHQYVPEPPAHQESFFSLVTGRFRRMFRPQFVD